MICDERLPQEDVDLIALVTMAEVEGECEEGKHLVIDAILNRVDSKHFPDTVHKYLDYVQLMTYDMCGGKNTMHYIASKDKIEKWHIL